MLVFQYNHPWVLWTCSTAWNGDIPASQKFGPYPSSHDEISVWMSLTQLNHLCWHRFLSVTWKLMSTQMFHQIIWIENSHLVPSFSCRVDGSYSKTRIPGWQPNTVWIVNLQVAHYYVNNQRHFCLIASLKAFSMIKINWYSVVVTLSRGFDCIIMNVDQRNFKMLG